MHRARSHPNTCRGGRIRPPREQSERRSRSMFFNPCHPEQSEGPMHLPAATQPPARDEALQPALGPRDPRRLDTVAGAKLADRLRKIISHCAVRQSQFVSDIAAGHAFAGQAAAPGALGRSKDPSRPTLPSPVPDESRAILDAHASRHRPTLPRAYLSTNILMPRPQAPAANILRAQTSSRSRRAFPSCRRFNSAATSSPLMCGISISVIKTSGFCASTASSASLPLRALTDNRNVAFNLKQRRQRAEHHPLILGQHDANRSPTVFRIFSGTFFGQGIHASRPLSCAATFFQMEV